MHISKRLLIPNRLSSLHHVRRGVRLFVKTHVNEKWEFKLVLAIDEAISNIIEHGFPTQNKSKIVLQMEIIDSGVIFTIVDKGIYFNPNDKIKSIFEKSPQIKTEGFGLILLYSIVKINYQQGENKENILILQKMFSEMD